MQQLRLARRPWSSSLIGGETVAKTTNEFSSVEHLSAEAVAGYVDRELSPGAMRRATAHLMKCADCRAEVRAQRNAADRLRRSSVGSGVHIPPELMEKLTGLAATHTDSAAATSNADKPSVLDALQRVFQRRHH